MTRLAGSFAVLVAALAFVALAGGSAAADEGAPVRIVLEITDEGYRCAEGCDVVDFSPGVWEPEISVPMGALVELGFVWAHDATPTDEHVMRIDGYRLASHPIDYGNRETTLRFVADQAGSFSLRCDLDCDLHDSMQNAVLRVRRVGGGGTTGASIYTPTVLSLHASALEVRRAGPVMIDAILTDADGEPIARAELDVYVMGEFVGARGLMHVGSAWTDEQGMASYRLIAQTSALNQQVLVRFAGLGVYDESEERLVLRVTDAPAATYLPQTTRFEQVAGTFGRASVAVLVLALWSTFGFVLLQVVYIARDRADG